MVKDSGKPSNISNSTKTLVILLSLNLKASLSTTMYFPGWLANLISISSDKNYIDNPDKSNQKCLLNTFWFRALKSTVQFHKTKYPSLITQ